MMTAFGWVLFGMAVWGLCILMQALERRFAPDLGTVGAGRRKVAARPPKPPQGDPRDAELAELRRRVETLEAIVTDRRYQWEQEFRRSA